MASKKTTESADPFTPEERRKLIDAAVAEGGEITALLALYAKREIDFPTLKERFAKLNIREPGESQHPFNSPKWWQEIEDSIFDDVELGTWEEVSDAVDAGLITTEEAAELREAWFAAKR